MPPKHRKVPYSGKKKKQQLQQKNAKKLEKKLEKDARDPSSFDYLQKSKPLSTSFLDSFVKAQTDPRPGSSEESKAKNRLKSVFEKMPAQAIEKEKLKSMKPLQRLPKTCLEIPQVQFEETIEFPKRPYWDYDMTKEQVEEKEQVAFQSWLDSIQEKYGTGEEMSWYERNLEVWRQLWRVLEISDVVLIVMDIRHPLLHFPRSLYNFITQDLKKSIIGVFNKVDLVSSFTVFAWKKYFEQTFPQLKIATFSCYPPNERLLDDTVPYALRNQVKKPRKRYYHAQGVQELLEVCSQVIDKPTVAVDWPGLIARYDQDAPKEESHVDQSSEDDSDTESTDGLEDMLSSILDIDGRAIQPHQDYITLGLVGHPNVGKSSLINSIMKRTVVSASKTPGHTKHFQTIHIADRVRLCDSPGLVFPAKIPRALQILSGMYPIAQVQEPYSAIGYLAERLPLERILSLSPVDKEAIQDFQWSTWTLCEAFAEQRGFHTAKTAQPDIYRAANAILRLTAEGRILLSFKPPGFLSSHRYEHLRVVEADENRTHTQSNTSDSEPDQPAMTISRGGFSVLASDSE
ncbi:hypothetical protein BY458DRAFT_543950 [Sporodiniella umbellata]|nr:hypothetical protein BY458DRAFT_543950 [Sporodiniella umbellata]